MKVKINGNEVEIIQGTTIDSYLLKNNYRIDMVAIEHNMNIIKKGNWNNIELKENDELEIIAFMGGG